MEILEKGTNIIKNKFNSECGYFFQARKVTSWNITKFHFLTGGGGGDKNPFTRKSHSRWHDET